MAATIFTQKISRECTAKKRKEVLIRVHSELPRIVETDFPSSELIREIGVYPWVRSFLKMKRFSDQCCQ